MNTTRNAIILMVMMTAAVLAASATVSAHEHGDLEAAPKFLGCQAGAGWSRDDTSIGLVEGQLIIDLGTYWVTGWDCLPVFVDMRTTKV